VSSEQALLVVGGAMRVAQHAAAPAQASSASHTGAGRICDNGCCTMCPAAGNDETNKLMLEDL